jgi:hypothetical protein
MNLQYRPLTTSFFSNVRKTLLYRMNQTLSFESFSNVRKTLVVKGRHRNFVIQMYFGILKNN